MMSSKRNICIIVSTLGLGGAEKVAALQSKMLSELGHTIYVLSISEIDGQSFDFSGEVLVLENKGRSRISILNKFERLLFLKKFLKKKRIDVIIDHRSRQNVVRELFLKNFIYAHKTIFMIHSMGVIHTSNFSTPFVRGKFMFHYLYSNVELLVSVSTGISEKIRSVHNFDHVKTLHNSFQLPEINSEGRQLHIKNYILFFGRLEEESKDLTFLINAYHTSSLPSNGVKLVLMGSGPDGLLLRKLVQELELEESIQFVDHNSNPFPIVRNALFTVLTSHYEGFPMSIVESLACNTPVISVDCESGPRELIRNNYNGLLVEKSLEKFTDALDKMSSNKELLTICKNNCQESIEHLSFENIKKEWGNLIDSI